jgi:hypothetical protein
MEDAQPVVRSTALKDLPSHHHQPHQLEDSYIERLWRTRGSMRVAALAVLVVLAALAVHALVDGTVVAAAVDLSRAQVALLRAVYPTAVLVVLWTLASDKRGRGGRRGGGAG